ncbi:MAG: response regulator transcription factor [Dongiaceae bacterium]
MRILLVEDHEDLSRMVADHLSDRGFVVDMVGALEDARAALSMMNYDLMILDLNLPDGDGRDLVRISTLDPDPLPTIVISAHDSLAERLASLNGGADDYMAKPFSILELEARVRAVLRRPRRRELPCLECGTLSLDPASREVSALGTSIRLNKRETDLLEQLLRNAGRHVTRRYLERHLYSFDEPVTPNALEAVVSRLRRRLKVASADVRIETRRGIGYRLVVGGDTIGVEELA